MVWVPKGRNVLFFIGILFFSETQSNEILKFNFRLTENLSGFHRILCYNILLENMNSESSIVIKEMLPKHMYVDTYQVSGNDGILVKEFVDCEIPAYLASAHEVMLCSISKTGTHEICMPIHFRYQVPHSCKIYGESATIHMATPSISVNKIDNYSNAVSVGCFKTLGSLMYHGNPNVEPLSFKIPVGCTEDFYQVLFLCAIVIPVSSVYLSLKLIKTNKAFSEVIT